MEKLNGNQTLDRPSVVRRWFKKGMERQIIPSKPVLRPVRIFWIPRIVRFE